MFAAAARGRWLGLAVLTAIPLLAARCCTYAPDPVSGTLHCGPSSSCPTGNTCAADQTCWKDGETPSGAAGTSGAAGAGAAGTSGAAGAAGGAGGMVTTGPASFVGHWVYQAGSTENVSCTDMTQSSPSLAGDYVDVVLDAGTLTATYFCAWNVDLDSNMTTTVIRSGQSCSRTMTDSTTGDITHLTWHGTAFTMKTTDAATATLQATIAADYIDDPRTCGPTSSMPTTSCTGTCSIKIDGTLVKSP